MRERATEKKQEDFLDIKTFLAIGLLILSWFAWDHYMRKKYPESFKKKTSFSESAKPAPTTATPAPSQKFQAKKPLHIQKLKEKTLQFKGKKLNIEFSSLGFGIKAIELKSHYDRDKNPIYFDPLSGPLFWTSFSHSADPQSHPLPFQISQTKEGNVFLGEFSSKKLKLTKEIRVIEDQFLLKVKSKLELKEGAYPLKNRGEAHLSLNFSHPISPKTSSQGFFQKFFVYGEDSLKAFVYQGSGQSQRLSLEEIEEEPSPFLLKSAALGSKYFGKAFINKSEILPSIHFRVANFNTASSTNRRKISQPSLSSSAPPKTEKGVAAARTREELLARLDYSFSDSSQKVQNLEYEIFVGPKSLKNLQTLGGGLEKWPDFGFFSWMARPLLLFLNQIFNFCGNWGLSIIILTFFIRLCLLPINLKSYKSMKVMQKIQPEIKALKEAHKKDPKKMNQEVMRLMKTHKANPLAGCLPLFLQFPIVFALYRALGESIELYQSPFVLWIEDLSLKDPYYVLPLASGLIFFVQQLISPMNLPKEQAIMIKVLPLVFSLFMLSLPSGLTLYIFVTSFFGLIQQAVFLKTGLSYFNKEKGKKEEKGKGGKNA